MLAINMERGGNFTRKQMTTCKKIMLYRWSYLGKRPNSESVIKSSSRGQSGYGVSRSNKRSKKIFAGVILPGIRQSSRVRRRLAGKSCVRLSFAGRRHTSRQLSRIMDGDALSCNIVRICKTIGARLQRKRMSRSRNCNFRFTTCSEGTTEKHNSDRALRFLSLRDADGR